MGQSLPKLYVEGADDISCVSALLSRHGLNTQQGVKHLFIKSLHNDDAVLDAIPLAVRQATSTPVGFVIDIDIETARRWEAVRSRLSQIGLSSPSRCPKEGYVGQMPNYPFRFGIWLMPDCETDETKLEHLVQTLLPKNDPLWSHAQQSTADAAATIDKANESIQDPDKKWKRFRDCHRIKAEVRSWLAWQIEPGCALGAAINDRILGCDSPEAIAFLRWIKQLYGFSELNV